MFNCELWNMGTQLECRYSIEIAVIVSLLTVKEVCVRVPVRCTCTFCWSRCFSECIKGKIFFPLTRSHCNEFSNTFRTTSSVSFFFFEHFYCFVVHRFLDACGAASARLPIQHRIWISFRVHLICVRHKFQLLLFIAMMFAHYKLQINNASKTMTASSYIIAHIMHAHRLIDGRRFICYLAYCRLRWSLNGFQYLCFSSALRKLPFMT